MGRDAIDVMTRARAVARVREIVLRAVGDRDARVYLFGSSVKGPVRRSSDIDLAIDVRGHRPASLLATIREALDESDVPYDVDVVDLAEAAPEVRARIEREGVRWTG